MRGYSTSSQCSTSRGLCSNARRIGFCGVNPHRLRYRPTVQIDSDSPIFSSINWLTDSRVQRKKESLSWSGRLSITIRAMRFCCSAVSEPPLGRPWRLARRARSPPSRYVFIHLPTAYRVTPYTSATSSWVRPDSTAATARLRSASLASAENDLASWLVMKPR
jgi:hypothetical protein